MGSLELGTVDRSQVFIARELQEHLSGKLLKEKHPDVEWDITILKSGPLGGDQQIGSRIVEGEIDLSFFFFTDPMTLPAA